jgi:hypothetical protein
VQPQSRDTSPDVDALMIERYRSMSAEDKLRMMQDMIDFTAAMQLQEIKLQHPNADERELKLRLASRWTDPKLLKAAFGWDAEVMGY